MSTQKEGRLRDFDSVKVGRRAKKISITLKTSFKLRPLVVRRRRRKSGVGHVMVRQRGGARVKLVISIRGGYVTGLHSAAAIVHPVAVGPHEAGTEGLAPLAKGRRRNAPGTCPQISDATAVVLFQ